MQIENKLKFAAVLAALSLAAGAAGCSSPAQTQGAAGGASPASAANQSLISEARSQVEISSPPDTANAVGVSLNGASISVDGPGAKAEGSTLTITEAGTYQLSGTLDDGQIVVNAPDSAKVYLLLSGANITSKTSAAIYCAQADKLIVTLADGSQNTLTDAVDYTYADAAAEEPDAALFSKVDLEINGSGSLTVNGNFKNGVGTKDDLVIAGGSLTVSAKNDGLRGRDSVSVLDGSLNLTAGGDGIQSNNDEDTAKGWILIEGGNLTIDCANDGVQAETGLTVTGGTFSVKAGGGAARAQTTAASDTGSDSFKGLKAGGDLMISGGTFTIDSYDDSIHSNGDIGITGGMFTLSTADDGVHADGNLDVNADINVLKSYEGLEGTNVTISGGKIDIFSDDDGINAAGGGDTNGGGRFGPDAFRTMVATATAASPAPAGGYSLNITGGDITVNAGDDGLDSNGVINISGGSIVVLIRGGGGGTGAIDGDGNLTVTGGILIYGGMATGQNPGGNSTQSYVYAAAQMKAGSAVTLQKDGATLAGFTPAIDCQTIVFSTPEIVSGESYQIYSGTELLTEATAGTGGGMGGPGGGMRGARPPMG